MSCLLDPRCKDLSFLESEEIAHAKTQLEVECLKIARLKAKEPPTVAKVKVEHVDQYNVVQDEFSDNPESDIKPPLSKVTCTETTSVPLGGTSIKSEQKSTSDSQSSDTINLEGTYAVAQDMCFEDFLKDVVITRVERPMISTFDQVAHEVKLYLNELAIPLSTCPLAWWKSKSVVYPNVSCLAKQILCVPGTSVPSETVFSTAGYCSDKSRSSLSPETLDKMIFPNKTSKSLYNLKQKVQ